MNKISLHQEPIFIVGFPRSGTTFLQSMLSTQPGLVSFPETHFFNKAVGHYQSDYLLKKDDLEEVVQVLKDKTGVAFDDSIIQTKELQNQKVMFELLIVELAKKQNIEMDNKLRWIEKTPAHAMFMSKISDYYPKAKFIAIKRNPLNAIDSYYRKLVDHRKPHHDLAMEYKNTYEAIDEFSLDSPDKVKLISYEDLVLNRNSTMMGIMNFLGTELSESDLDNHSNAAKKLIRENETWKETNKLTDREYSQQSHRLSIKHILQIQYILKSFMNGHEYPLEKGFYMGFYNIYRSLVNR